MAAAVCVVGASSFMIPYMPRWYCTISATACVSAADPDRQHQMVSWTCVSLSVTRFAMYAPVVVRLSAPRITPSLKLMAMLPAVNIRRSRSLKQPAEAHIEVPKLGNADVSIWRAYGAGQCLVLYFSFL